MKYDFENDVWPDDERVPYQLMRWWFLGLYYTYCRSKIHSNNRWNKGWAQNEDEIGYAYEQYECAFERPVEMLMLEVLTLVLRAGRGPEQAEPYHRAKIAEILAKNDLQDMLNALPKGERDEFEHDLRVLKIF